MTQRVQFRTTPDGACIAGAVHRSDPPLVRAQVASPTLVLHARSPAVRR